MYAIESEKVEPAAYEGRRIRKIVEKGGVVESEKLSMGMAEFSTAIGPMKPHKHEEEGIYVIEALNCYTRFGDTRDTLGEKTAVKQGMFLLYGKDEWHLFEFEGEGYLKIVFFFATGDLKRPQ